MPNVIPGSPNNDTIPGTIGDDLIDALEGNDSVTGDAGSDTILVGAGQDTLSGGFGNDSIEGGADYNYLSGDQSNDTLVSGNDGGYSDGGAGNDSLVGGLGNDNLFGGDGADSLFGGDGSDNLSDATDTFEQGSDNRLDGGAGDDGIEVYNLEDSSAANNQLSGGAGNDYLSIQGYGTATLRGGDGNDVLTSYNYNASPRLLDGGSGDDQIIAVSQTGIIDAGAGNDTVTLAGYGGGPLTVTLGSGRDMIQPDIATQATVTDFAAGIGGDRVDLTRLLNEIIGYDGSNPFGPSGYLRLVQDGADTLLQVDADGAAGGTAFTTLFRFQNTTAASFTAGNFTPAWPMDVNAPPDQTIIGTPSGDQGATSISGTIGNDLIDAKAGDDYVTGNDGADTILGGAGRDTLLGGLGNDLIEGGRDNDELHGELGDDTLSGGYGNDIIFGEEGNDTVILYGTTAQVDGGSGDDTCIVFGFAVLQGLSGGDGYDILEVHGSVQIDAAFGGQVLDVEAISFGDDGTATVQFYGNYFLYYAAPLIINGSQESNVVLFATLSYSSIDLSNWIFVDWDASADFIQVNNTGMNGSQLNFVGSSQSELVQILDASANLMLGGGDDRVEINSYNGAAQYLIDGGEGFDGVVLNVHEVNSAHIDVERLVANAYWVNASTFSSDYIELSASYINNVVFDADVIRVSYGYFIDSSFQNANGGSVLVQGSGNTFEFANGSGDLRNLAFETPERVQIFLYNGSGMSWGSWNATGVFYGSSNSDDIHFRESTYTEMIAGDGDDRFVYDSSYSGLSWTALDGGSGNDTLIAAAQPLDISGWQLENIEHIVTNGQELTVRLDQLSGLQSLTAFEGDSVSSVNLRVAVGGQFADLSQALEERSIQIYGSWDSEHIIVGAGNDFVSGDAGDDTLVGGEGFDTLWLSGSRSEYVFSGDSSSFTSLHLYGYQGIDLIQEFEFVQFGSGEFYQVEQLVNLPPTLSVPDTQYGSEDTPLALTGVVFDDANNDDLYVFVTVEHGVLCANSAGGAEVFESGSAAVTIVGKSVDVNAVLADLIYIGETEFSGTDWLYVYGQDNYASISAAVAIELLPVNDAPFVTLSNVVSSTVENGAAMKVADIAVTDDALGSNALALTGADAAAFSIIGNELWFTGGANYEAKSSYQVAVTVDDTTVGSTPDATSALLTLAITDVNEMPSAVTLTNVVSSTVENGAAMKVADIAVTDDALGSNALALTGADAVAFSIIGNELWFTGGANYEAKSSYQVAVTVDDTTVGSTPDATSEAFTLNITDANDNPTGGAYIFGIFEEDNSAVASNNIADQDGIVSASYQWFRNGSAVVGANLGSYAFGDDDVGSTFSVRLTFTDGLGNISSVDSDIAGPIVNVNDIPTGDVLIAGTVTEQSTLSASTTLADADGLGTINYQWLRNGSFITGATNSIYTLARTDVGASISVEAFYTDAHGTFEIVTSGAVGPVASATSPPTDIFLSPDTVTEDAAAGTVVGSLSATDPNVGDTHTFAIVGGAANLFEIVGGQVRVKAGAVLDYETATSHNIDVQATDQTGQVYTETLTINVGNVAGLLTLTDLNDAVGRTLSGVAEEDLISGLGGNDKLFGFAGNDTLLGGDGNDSLDGGVGADSLVGGAGNDTYIVDNSADVVDEGNGSGVDTGGVDLVNASASFVLGSFIENLTLTGTAAISGTGNTLANRITGNAGANTLSGLDGNDTLLGGLGSDTLLGGTGNDSLDGGSDADSLVGGSGNDIYVVDSPGDVADESDGLGGDAGGTDIVNASVTTTLGAFIENLTLTGAANIDGTGNDLANRITGNTGANMLSGLGGNDTLIGGTSNDTLLGGAENDSIDGGVGADSLVGGSGNDTYVVDNAGDVTDDSDGLGGDAGGIDQVNATASTTLGAFIENLTLTGSANIDGTGNDLANRITGNTGANTLSGLGGNDTLLGGTSNDTLLGGTGNDSLDGGVGTDSLVGGDGNDTYLVDNVGDVTDDSDGLGGDAGGIDQVNASASTTLGDFIENLTLTGAANINGTGNDLANRITGNTGANTLSGLGGNDTLIGGTSNDTLLGGTGNDSLDGGIGADSLRGGDGDDTYIVDTVGDVTDDSDGLGGDAGGIDLVNATATTTLGAYIENLTLTGSAAIGGTGNSLDNTITGNTGANTLSGGDGNDTLLGGSGNDRLLGGIGGDRLDGGVGNDTLAGGAGDDSYVVNVATDAIDETDGGGNDAGGIDTVLSSVTWTLGAHLENLTLTGATSINGTGNALANLMTGNSGSNSLSGGDGVDTLLGGGGNDRLDGGTGADSLVGGAGNDTYTVDSNGDVIDEGDGLGGDAGGIDLVNASASTTLSSYVETLTLLGGDDIFGTGNSLGNKITGNTGANDLSGLDGNDTLIGGLGHDTLSGGAGTDSLTGGAGQDYFVFGASSLSTGIDRVSDFSVLDDTIILDRLLFTQVFGDASNVLLASNFIKGPAALTADQHIIYNAATGALLYDADGNGAGAAQQFATLNANLNLTAADFVLV